MDGRTPTPPLLPRPCPPTRTHTAVTGCVSFCSRIERLRSRTLCTCPCCPLSLPLCVCVHREREGEGARGSPPVNPLPPPSTPHLPKNVCVNSAHCRDNRKRDWVGRTQQTKRIDKNTKRPRRERERRGSGGGRHGCSLSARVTPDGCTSPSPLWHLEPTGQPLSPVAPFHLPAPAPSAHGHTVVVVALAAADVTISAPHPAYRAWAGLPPPSYPTQWKGSRAPTPKAPAQRTSCARLCKPRMRQ